MRRMLKETQERVRLFEENQRRWQQDQMQTQQQSVVRVCVGGFRGEGGGGLCGGSRIRCKHSSSLWYVCVREGGLGGGGGWAGGRRGGGGGCAVAAGSDADIYSSSLWYVCVWGAGSRGAGLCSVPD